MVQIRICETKLDSTQCLRGTYKQAAIIFLDGDTRKLHDDGGDSLTSSPTKEVHS